MAYVSVARIHLQVITIHVIIMTLTHLTQGHTNGKMCDKTAICAAPVYFVPQSSYIYRLNLRIRCVLCHQKILHPVVRGKG